MRILFIGDTHGDRGAFCQAIDFAVANSISEVAQLGDWGFIWNHPHRVDDRSFLSDYLKKCGVSMRFIDGNHDVHRELVLFERDKTDNAAPNLTYQHRGSFYQYPNGPSVVFLGGAPSIDYRGRVENISWWPEEMITDQDVEEALKHQNKQIDILVTHDAPYMIDGFKETHDMTYNYRQKASHDQLQRVLKALNPRMVVHGHMHHRYMKTVDGVTIQGLGCNYSMFKNFVWIYEA